MTKKYKAKYLMIPLMLLKSFFSAVTQVAWGLGGMMLLNLLLSYMLKEGLPTSVDKQFLIVEQFIFNHMMLFVWVFFGVYLYFEVKELTTRSK